ncbi:GAK system XXXCH domain-containing protein [Nitratidesulfovibrio termitidis]|uniref:GAK system XXXCH domain-containing protein n=1 Tax=Nitratidesulfovibrio termitidis TaxID=42252 RepID=UPI0004051B38|nr:GAK system XXXCH domain-containing protein [Nitratidesulfovibrio termitidis]
MGSRKTTFSTTRQELPAVLRRIADALERGDAIGEPATAVPEDEADPLLASGLGDFRKFKLNAKHAFGQMQVVLKVKTPDAAATAAGAADADGTTTTGTGAGASHAVRAAGHPSYKSLKKRMRASFKALRQAVQAGVMPPPQAAASFLSDSLLMVEYPGYGDEHYAAYLAATEALRAALEAVGTGGIPAAAPADAADSAAAPAGDGGAAVITPVTPPVMPEIRHAVEELYRLMVLCHDRYK